MKLYIIMSSFLHIMLLYSLSYLYGYSGKKIVLHNVNVYEVDLISLPVKQASGGIQKPAMLPTSLKEEMIKKEELEATKNKKRLVSIPQKVIEQDKKKIDDQIKERDEAFESELEDREIIKRLMSMEKKWIKEGEKVKETISSLITEDNIKKEKYIEQLMSLEREWIKYEQVMDASNMTKDFARIRKMLGAGYRGNIFLNLANNIPSFYLDTIQTIIYSNWQPPLKKDIGANNAKVIVTFNILRNGNIKDIGLEMSSNNHLLDESALNAVKKVAKRLPPLPEEFKDDSLVVHFSFEYTKS